VMTLEVPPLRERGGDISLLVKTFAGDDWKIELDALQALSAYSWPGNVRQMINAIERAKILADEDVIQLKNLPSAISAPDASSTNPMMRSDTEETGSDEQLDKGSRQREHIIAVLKQAGGNKARSARALGVSRRTFYRLLDKFDITLDMNEIDAKPPEY